MCRLLKLHRWKHPAHDREQDLATYSRKEALKDRLFVRVLPGLESLSLCEKNGICGKQIIAMQGPFSLEMNRALIRQFDIKYLVTKESGRTGGFLEKIKAAEAEGITACVIGNPEKQNSGDSFAQVCRKISEITGKTIKNQIASSEPVWEMSRRSRWKQQKKSGKQIHFWSRTAAKDNKK